jgi:hypothetical protein
LVFNERSFIDRAELRQLGCVAFDRRGLHQRLESRRGQLVGYRRRNFGESHPADEISQFLIRNLQRWPDRSYLSTIEAGS